MNRSRFVLLALGIVLAVVGSWYFVSASFRSHQTRTPLSQSAPASLSMPNIFWVNFVPANASSPLTLACAALFTEGNQDGLKRYERLSDLVKVCGGADAVAPKIIGLLHNKDPNIRLAAAGASGLCYDLGFEHISTPPNGAQRLSPVQSNAVMKAFQNQMVPALAVTIQDRNAAVRVTAASSLRAIAHFSWNISWDKALSALAVALSDPNPQVRQQAAYTLAVVPADLSRITKPLWKALNNQEPLTHAYIFIALMHAAQTNRGRVLTIFLKPMTSPDPLQREYAATNIHQMAGPLWDGQFWPDNAPTEEYYNNDAEQINLSVWMPPYQGHISPAQQVTAYSKIKAANDTGQMLLLTALVTALTDPDRKVRIEAALSLEHIGRWTNAILGHGGAFREGLRVEAQVTAALGQAVTAINSDDPELSQRIEDLRTRILKPHDRA
jgi:HEAT repeat protein